MSTFIDSFDTSLSEMPYKDKSNPFSVLEVLKISKKFSVFEIDNRLAKSVDFLFKNHLIKQIDGTYPWVNISICDEKNAI
jgi:predicted RNA-binding protein (virulence factor B family)